MGRGVVPISDFIRLSGMHDAKTLKYELNLNSSRKQSERESSLNTPNVVVGK